MLLTLRFRDYIPSGKLETTEYCVVEERELRLTA